MKGLRFIGIDSWDRPVFVDDEGRHYKDVTLGKCMYPTLYYSSEFDGEPDIPLKEEYTIVKDFQKLHS